MPDKIDFLFKRPEDSPGYLLAQLTLIWQRKQKKVLDPLDLTQTQFVLLSSIAWLTNKSECVTQVEIADLNNFDRMMVSKVLRTLQTKKLITRQEHKTDTRAKIVTLTPNGKKILQTALSKVESADIEFFSSIGQKLSDLNATMHQLIEANKDE
ncbi:MarR family winged helix-turn-helix transcriptional regulator [Sphingobacterium mizutaii]|uniref:MarR family winged helix-turn-helix transcriptional regulator n=1 Tax=Sphingobacterium mizutaii TaxID=1010 RepID=UPI00162A161A|nr:MarR family transcriptional regulator [Sphingobacterium mizutaii]